MSTNQEYNGWTNYETWRVKLEIFDESECWWSSPNEVRHYAENLVIGDSGKQLSLADSYAFAFLQNVNWKEIWLALLNQPTHGRTKND
jgi:hypothetical protein